MARGAPRYLGANEEIVLEVRRHVVVLSSPIAAALAAIALAAAVGFLTSPDEGGDLIDTIFGLVAVGFFLRAGWRIWEWWADRIVVTTKRIIEVSGVLTRQVASMPLEKMTDLIYVRTLGGRLLGYGDLIVESAGQDQGLSRIRRLPRPDDFYRTVNSLSGDLLPEPDGGAVPPDLEDTGPLPRVIV